MEMKCFPLGNLLCFPLENLQNNWPATIVIIQAAYIPSFVVKSLDQSAEMRPCYFAFMIMTKLPVINWKNTTTVMIDKMNGDNNPRWRIFWRDEEKGEEKFHGHFHGVAAIQNPGFPHKLSKMLFPTLNDSTLEDGRLASGLIIWRRRGGGFRHG